MQVTMTVNGTEYTREIEGRMLLVHFLRDVLGLTGTHWGCDTSNCGSCGEVCPRSPDPRVRRDDWPLPDPKGQALDAVRALRDDIERRVRDLLAAEGLASNG